MSILPTLRRGAALAALALSLPMLVQAQSTTQFAGRATALRASLTAPLVNLNLVAADTGELDSAGGMRDASVATVNAPAPLAIALGLLTSGVAGSGEMTVASASTLALNSNVAGLLRVRAGVLQSTAKAVCADGAATLTGSSVVADLMIQDQPIVVTGEPNQTIELAGLARIVINEQVASGGRLIVNALHLTVGGPLAGLVRADVVIASSEAGITCGIDPGECSVTDFVTGGGYITLPDGSKGNFGFNGGQRPNGLRGNLQYNVQGRGDPNLNGQTLTRYSGSGDSRSLSFTCRKNGRPSNASCDIDVSDRGEPGIGVDRFAIRNGSYSAAGPLAGGNIQLHPMRGCSK